MTYSVDLKKIENSELTIYEFCLLYIIVQEGTHILKEIYEYSSLKEEENLKTLLTSLEKKLFIKILEEEEKIDLRNKSLKLFNINSSVSFEEFWDKYHNITGKLKTDQTPAEKKWKRLTKKEKQTATDKIQDYFYSVSDKKFCKKARTYLEDKNFNDEFKDSNYDVDWTRNHK